MSFSKLKFVILTIKCNHLFKREQVRACARTRAGNTGSRVRARTHAKSQEHLFNLK